MNKISSRVVLSLALVFLLAAPAAAVLKLHVTKTIDVKCNVKIKGDSYLSFYKTLSHNDREWISPAPIAGDKTLYVRVEIVGISKFLLGTLKIPAECNYEPSQPVDVTDWKVEITRASIKIINKSNNQVYKECTQ